MIIMRTAKVDLIKARNLPKKSLKLEELRQASQCLRADLLT
jgi:hypothetical protein